MSLYDLISVTSYITINPDANPNMVVANTALVSSIPAKRVVMQSFIL